ncbi:hypothetical protein ACA910_019137 [Epithemia clementina (nom. ined.)]
MNNDNNNFFRTAANVAGASFRHQIVQTSVEQRRNVPHAKSGMTRSLIDTLYDRQCRGARATYLARAPVCPECSFLSTSSSNNIYFDATNMAQQLKEQRRHMHSASPSTVFDTASLLQEQRAAAAGISIQDQIGRSQYDQNDSPQDDEISPAGGNALSNTEQQQTPGLDTASNQSATPPPPPPPSPSTPQSSSSSYRVSGPCNIHSELLYYVEYVSSVRYHSSYLTHLGGDDQRDEQGQRPLSSRAVSTISIAFSADGQTMASTHGDHTVKISCCVTGRLLKTLDGHPRTPWTVKFHPHNSNVVVSGCLGHQVRIWDWTTSTCLHMVRLEFAIISLTFHPSGQVLAIANGTRLHFWAVPFMNSYQQHQHRHQNRPPQQQQEQPNDHVASAFAAPSMRLTEIDQRHMLRCVHFPPDGKTLIIGGVNATTDDPRRRTRPGVGGGSTSFYLRLWDFHLDVALSPTRPAPTLIGSGLLQSLHQQQTRPKPITNPRVFVPRALLYNDGGFDVSPDGKFLCACVEYWLPEGVDNAMDLVNNEELLYEHKTKLEEDEQQRNRYHEFLKSNNLCNDSEFRSLDSLDAGSLHTSNNTNGSTLLATTPETQLRLTATTPNPTNSYPEVAPRTPEASISSSALLLSPPPPPGRRLTPSGSLLFGQHLASSGRSEGTHDHQNGTGSSTHSAGESANSPPPLPPGGNPPSVNGDSSGGGNFRRPHPLSTVTSFTFAVETRRGRYVPHVVTISLDTSPLDSAFCERITGQRQKTVSFPSNDNDKPSPTAGTLIPLPAVAVGYRPRLGQVLDACPLEPGKATAVTCVKFSPSTSFCLIGYGVREPVNGRENYHPVTSIYRIRGGGRSTSSCTSHHHHHHHHRDNPSDNSNTNRDTNNMCQISTMLSKEDDVNIARFHPDSGHGFVYGTKQGRVRVVSTRPWMFYHENDAQPSDNSEARRGSSST